MNRSWNLERFVDAQEPVYGQVCDELKQGEKRSHWMWFIFPQIAGLGSSPLAVTYALASLEEAGAYLAHPVLGPRLRECTLLVNRINDRTAQDVFGFTDAMKFRSSMTLFAEAASDNACFEAALQKFFDGARDRKTVERI